MNAQTCLLSSFCFSASTMRMRKRVELAEGLEFIEKGIKKLRRKLEGYPNTKITVVDKILLYTKVYDMCTQPRPHDYSKELYDKYREWMVEYMNSTVLPSLREKCDEQMLRELVEKWEFHKNLVRNLFCYFHYLDRFYTYRKFLPPVKVVGLVCFLDMVYKEFKGKLMEAMISMIARQREGKPFDGALIKNVLGMFVQLGITSLFVEEMLKEMSNYYCDSLIIEHSYHEYMLKVEECLEQEKSRISHYLDASSLATLLEEAENEFLSVYAKHYIEKEKRTILALLGDENMEELSRMFMPFSKEAIWSHMAYLLAIIFEHHVHTEAIALVSHYDTARNGQKFVQRVIELHEKCLMYVNECFHAHDYFLQVVTHVFKWLCNMADGGRQLTELLASFCDDVLKRDSGKRLSNEAKEETLEKAVKLLPYVCAKNHFTELYREKLERRLLSGSSNDHCERNALEKVKRQLGNCFQYSMEQMVDDIISGKETQVSFRDYIDRNTSVRPGIDLAVTVLATRLWQNFKPEDLNLPPEMAKCVEVFGEYYGWKTSNRKITWIHSVGTCNVVGRFKPKTMELIVTPIQAATLLLFNSANRLSYSAISLQLNMTEDNVDGLLHSLSCAGHKILNKKPATEPICPTDYFEFNSTFTDRTTVITIPPPPVSEKRKKAIEVVDKDWRYSIEASIVRIMKSRMVLAHNMLVAECVKQLGCMFKPDIKVIKERIEDLMERDYLERDSNDPNCLRYVA